MAECIKRESANEFVCQICDTSDGTFCVRCDGNLLKSIPAADVVPVVRCRECIYWEPASPTRTSGNCNRSFDIPAWATDFCSYGKRKDGGQGDG